MRQPLDPAAENETREHRAAGLRRFEESRRELATLEKDAAVGILARGVAHELNNPLQGVLGFAELLLRDLRAGEPDKDRLIQHLEWIERSALRCKRIVDGLLNFTAATGGDRMFFDLLGILELPLGCLAEDFRRQGIEVASELGDAPIPVVGQPVGLLQAFHNVLANARESMPRGGRLEVAVLRCEGRVRVRFRDSGCGIPPDVLPRIFDPFFTTKEIGQGAGLGLSIARGIVRNHGGEIQIESALGSGTTVDVDLPVRPAPAG